jgi:hypothetical protein
VRHRDRWIAREPLHQPFEHPRQQQIVGIQEDDELPAGARQAGVPGSAEAAVRLGEPDDAAVALLVLRDDLAGKIPGAVVDDDGFPVAERLKQGTMMLTRGDVIARPPSSRAPRATSPE